MKVLKEIITGSLLISAIVQVSWWGSLPEEERAAIVIGSALILGNSY